MNIELPPERIADFCRRWGIRELALFGSVLRDDFRPDSDVDVLVKFDGEPPATYAALVEMEDELAAIVGRRVDLVQWQLLRNPFVRQHVRRHHRVVYAA